MEPGPRGRRIVDLSHPLENGMPTYPAPWHPVTEVVQLGRFGVEGRESRRVTLGTHTGTHLDAPRHFIPGGATVDELDPDALLGPATILDLTEAEPNRPVTGERLATMLGERRPERLVLRFDWSDHWGTPRFYADHPYLATDAAELLVDRGVRLLGLDSPTPDSPTTGRGGEPDSPNHHTLLGAGVILLEYLCNLRSLRHEVVELVVLPLRIVGADGSPVRCLAIESS